MHNHPPSSEIITKKLSNRGLFIRLVRYFFHNVITVLRSYFLRTKWAHHADSRSFSWDWNQTPYNRIAVVNMLLNTFEDPVYLEIGCATNALFNAVPTLKKIGVDPVRGGNVRKTSDDFFLSNEILFDVVFIDGLHVYSQVRRDVINSLKFLRQGGGWIALHDMLPRNWIEHHVPIVSYNSWTGDVWKVAFELIETEGIEFKILKIDHGVGIIKVIDPNATLKNLEHLLLDKEFSYYCNNIDQLPIVTWDDAQEWLRS
jgi:hypothetical protein